MEQAFGTLNDCYIPDNNNKHNYLIDTCALSERLFDRPNDIKKMVDSLNRHYKYYITEMQYREASGMPDKTRNYDSWEVCPKRGRLLKIMDELKTKRVSCYGDPCELYLVILDSTYRCFEDPNSDDKRVQMFYEIFNNNIKHFHDAAIGEAAIYNNCSLISVDTRLIKKVNKFFPGAAIHYDEFIKEL